MIPPPGREAASSLEPDIQRALQQSEIQLRSALDSASMVLWVLDRDGVFTYSHGKILETLGLRAAEVVGRSVFEMYADYPEVIDDARRALAGEEFTAIREVAGITFEIRYSTLRDERGKPAGVIGIAVDVTERRRVEADRERALSLLRASLESTADGILVVDSTGAIVTYNNKFAEMWGIPAEVMESGDDTRAIQHVLAQLQDPDSFIDRVKELYANPEAQSFDVVRFRNGRVFERYSQPQRVGDAVVGRVWSFRDVTERRRTEEDLRRREEQLRHTQRLARLGSWRWDVGSTTVEWSDELYRIYGRDPATYTPTYEGYLDAVHPDDRERVRAILDDALGGGTNFEFIERIIRPDGEVRVLRSLGEVVHDELGAPLRLIGACQDITEQEQAREALRHAEASYRAIFDLANDAIFVHDIETGHIVDANPAACDLGQTSLEELKELGIPGISHGEHPYTGEEALAFMRRAAAGEPQRFEWLVKRRSGERVWVEVDLRRIAIAGEDRLLATVRDITQRKAAEAVLKRSHEELEQLVAERTSELAATNAALQEEIAERQRAEQQLYSRTTELEAIFGALPDLYFRLDSTGRILDHRTGRDSTLVLAPQAYIGEPLSAILPEAARSDLEAALEEVNSTGKLARIEYRMPMDGEDRYFEARFLPIGNGEIVSLVRDITERQRAEAELRAREEHYRRLIENSSDVATILGPDGINRYQSPSITYVLGYSPEDMVGTSAFERIHPEDVPLCREVLGKTFQNPGTTHSVEFRYRHKDGSWRVLEARARTILPDSAAEGVIVNSRDVTERKRYEEALRLAKDEAERANRAKSEFLSRMSHELRTPMNSILGFGQLLERKALPPDQRRGVEHILKAGRHLLNLINEVLEIARIEAGRQNFSLEPVRVASVVREARSLIQPLAAQRQLTIDECPIDEQLFVRADRQRLIQVLLNLLSNAVKYNRPEGVVSVLCEVRPREDGEGAEVCIGIRDTGPGIPPDKLDRLFVPFDRLGAEQSQEEGTGLGLALSQRLVDAMAGRLTVESVVGEGSTFWVALARDEEPTLGVDRSAERKDGKSAGDDDRPPATLLYIEDNLANMALIESILADRPEITVLSALQGQMGLYLAVEHRPDLILLDMHLPDIDGDEVLRRLRQDARTRDIPVVMVSADATSATIDKLTRQGASGYLTKPIDVGEFLETVERYAVEPKRGRAGSPG